uniref:Uncharacterized protein n=1 Tax=Solanum tuberosum TaxID=4113 RepID=M0ZKY1_SOLTU
MFEVGILLGYIARCPYCVCVVEVVSKPARSVRCPKRIESNWNSRFHRLALRVGHKSLNSLY